MTKRDDEFVRAIQRVKTLARQHEESDTVALAKMTEHSLTGISTLAGRIDELKKRVDALEKD
jgi:hypothetical protein